MCFTSRRNSPCPGAILPVNAFHVHVPTFLFARGHARVRLMQGQDLEEKGMVQYLKGSLWRRKTERADFRSDNEKGFIFSC